VATSRQRGGRTVSTNGRTRSPRGEQNAAPSPGPQSIRSALTVFAVPNYRRFVGGQSISLIGSWAETVALALLVLKLTDSATVLGLVMGTRYLPVLLGTAYAGVIVDRHDKRRVLMLSSSALGVTSLAIGASVLAHTIALWQIFVSAMIFGVMTCLDNPARMALIPELVGRAMLRQAVTTNSILANVGRAVGPAIAAALIHTFGLGWCFVFNALSFALVVIALLALNTDALRPSAAVARAGRQLRDGLAVARGNRDILGPLVMMVFVGTLTYEFETSLPIFAEQTLRGGIDAYSWLTTSFGIGSIAAGLVLIRWPQTGLARMIYAAGGFGTAMALLTASPTLAAAIAAAGLVGAASIGFLTTGNATIQLAAPPQMRGRVTALWTTAFVGSTPVGAVLIGMVAHSYGGRAALGIGIAGCCAAICAGLLIHRALPVPIPQLFDSDNHTTDTTTDKHA